jgi:hypothetical protein
MEQRDHSQRGIGFKTAAILIALLMSLALSAQAAHVHLESKTGTAKHCSVCSAGHIAPPTLQSHLPHADAARQANPVIVAAGHHTQFRAFSLFTRPPPSA